MLKQSLAMIVICLGVATAVLAQDWEMPKPTEQHEFLKKFAGKWSTHSEMTMVPDQTITCDGTMTSKMLGEFWVINETNSTIMGENLIGMQTIGYDPKKEKFVGVWVDSATNHMWHYEGKLENEDKKLALKAKGPNFMNTETETDFIDSYEFVSADFFKFESSMLGEDGKWITFAKGEMKRIK